MFKLHIRDQSQVTTVWNTGETGDINRQPDDQTTKEYCCEPDIWSNLHGH